MKIKSIISTAISLISSAFILSPTAALAQAYFFQIQGKLIWGAAAMGGLEYNRSNRFKTSFFSIPSYKSSNVNIPLRAGKTYAIMAACEDNCSDIDLKIYDGYGNLIDSETGPDVFPYVQLTPKINHTFTLQVTMGDCRVSRCYYGIDIYEK